MSPKHSLSKRLELYASVLEDRRRALDLIAADLEHSEYRGGTRPLEGFTLAVDWSEVHAYICGSGLRKSDQLFMLFEDDDGEAPLIDGAHQAALSFLFHGIPNPKLVLPPHVVELETFTVLASRFVDLNHVDEAALAELHNRLLEKNEAISELHKIYQHKRAKLGDDPSDAQIIRIFDELSDEHAASVRHYARSFFGPMFLLGRWLSVEAFKELRSLLSPNGEEHGKLCFLRDHPDTRSISVEKGVRYSDYRAWRGIFPKIPDKSGELIENDSRAVAILNWLHSRLDDEQHQLLFFSRGHDIASTFSQYPEWFSCLGDSYHPVVETPNNQDSAWTQPRLPTLQRDWHYCLQLGSVWADGTIKQIRPLLEERRDWTDSVLSTIRDVRKGTVSAKQVQATIDRYLDGEEAAGMENAMTLWSAKGDSVANAGKVRKNIHIKESTALLGFLRYVTAPHRFRKQREQLRVDLEPVLRGVRERLPAVRQNPTSDRYKSLMLHVFEKVNPQELTTTMKSRHGLRIAQLLGYLVEGKELTSKDNVKLLQAERESRDDDARLTEIEKLTFALQAFLLRDYRRTRFLLGTARVVRNSRTAIAALLLADCWLLGEHSVSKADKIVRESKLAYWKGPGQSSLAIRNALLGMELDAAETHGEKPYEFRRQYDTDAPALRTAFDSVLKDLQSIEMSPLPDSLRGSVYNNIVYAAARLSLEDEEDTDDPVGGMARQAPPVEAPKVRRYAESLETLCDDRAARLDTLAYYHYRLAVHPRSLAYEERIAHIKNAYKYIEAALVILDEADEDANGPGADPRTRRIVEAHHYLIRRCLVTGPEE